MRSGDRTELVVQRMVISQVLDDEVRLEDNRIAKMANAIGKVLGG